MNTRFRPMSVPGLNPRHAIIALAAICALSWTARDASACVTMEACGQASCCCSADTDEAVSTVPAVCPKAPVGETCGCRSREPAAPSPKPAAPRDGATGRIVFGFGIHAIPRAFPSAHRFFTSIFTTLPPSEDPALSSELRGSCFMLPSPRPLVFHFTTPPGTRTTALACLLPRGSSSPSPEAGTVPARSVRAGETCFPDRSDSHVTPCIVRSGCRVGYVDGRRVELWVPGEVGLLLLWADMCLRVLCLRRALDALVRLLRQRRLLLVAVVSRHMLCADT